MPRKRRSEEMLAQVRRDRLSKHLNEVEQVISEWISELGTPSPFVWSESEEAIEFEAKNAAMPVRGRLAVPTEYQVAKVWKGWACRSQYVPPKEQDPITNHMLRKHLRKRSLWTNHTKWERRLNTIIDLALPVCNRAAQLVGRYRGQWEVTEDYEGTAVEKALDLAVGLEWEQSYSQKPVFSRGVWCGDILIEKSARPEEVEKVGDQHRQLIRELAQSEEMLALANEWREVLVLEARMRELANKALKSSDILYPCQFCRRLW
jgi:hypothetical protein